MTALLAACNADVVIQDPPPAAGGNGGSAGAGGMGGSADGGAGFVLQPADCGPDFAKTVDSDGQLVCGDGADGVLGSVNTRCHFYYGWRDGCNGCTSHPSKLGRASGNTCNSILGGDNSCAPAMLADTTLQLFGLNTDGDVNGDDKFYFGMYCSDLDTAPKGAPCEDGELLAGVVDGTISCISVSALVSQHLRNDCRLYAGWRDSCDGCSEPPSKWGWVNSVSCDPGAGADNTCVIMPQGPWDVHLLGINTDGNVNGDDKFYIGLSCPALSEQTQQAFDQCPEGMAISKVNDDGSLSCKSPLANAMEILSTSCRLYSGWRDGCNGCSTPPAKWGRVWGDSCELGVGADGTCGSYNLGGEDVQLFGLNPDGDVDGNDKFYGGMRCDTPAIDPAQ